MMKRGSIVPWLVALVCFGPFLAAMLFYYGPFGLPQLPGSRELLAPPVQLPEEWRAGAAPQPWQLIYARMSPCEEQCSEHLTRLKQVQLALGRDAERIRRVFWHAGALPPLDDAELTAESLDGEAGRRMAEALGAARLGQGRVYVADPRGAVILSYPPDVEQKELLRDLERLLSG